MKHWSLFICCFFLVLIGCDSQTPLSSSETVCFPGFWYDGICYSSEILQQWNIGSIEQAYYHVDRSYEWYCDQNSGVLAFMDCGPAVTVMAAKWSDETFPYTIKDTRNLYFKDGGTWLTTDVINALLHYDIPYTVIRFETVQQVIMLIRQGKILIICLKMSFIRFNPNPEERVDRFYPGDNGHFLIIKGVRIVDDVVWFEVYDSGSMGRTYLLDGTLKGKNRYYRAEEVMRTITEWWDGLIVISEKS